MGDDHEGGPLPQLPALALPDLAAVEDVHVALVEVVPVRVELARVAAVQAGVADLSNDRSVHSWPRV